MQLLRNLESRTTGHKAPPGLKDAVPSTSALAGLQKDDTLLQYEALEGSARQIRLIRLCRPETTINARINCELRRVMLKARAIDPGHTAPFHTPGAILSQDKRFTSTGTGWPSVQTFTASANSFNAVQTTKVLNGPAGFG